MDPPDFPFHLVPWWQWILAFLIVCTCIRIFIKLSVQMCEKDPGDYGVIGLFVVLMGCCLLLFYCFQLYNYQSPQWQPYFDQKAKFEQYNEQYRNAKERFRQEERQRETEWIHERMKQL